MNPAEVIAQQVTERVVDLVVSALDVNALLDRVDVTAVLRRVDVNALLATVDVNALLATVDLNEVLGKVDVNAVLDRVDLEPLLDRVDVNDLVSRVDMDALVERTDLGAVIARSSGGMATEALDAARSQAVGLDQFIDRWVRRLLRRKRPGPSAPLALQAVPSRPIPSRAHSTSTCAKNSPAASGKSFRNRADVA